MSVIYVLKMAEVEFTISPVLPLSHNIHVFQIYMRTFAIRFNQI